MSITYIESKREKKMTVHLSLSFNNDHLLANLFSSIFSLPH